MVNYYVKFLPKLAQLSQPFREILKKCKAWIWGQDQKDNFEQIKLAFHSSFINTRVVTDTRHWGGYGAGSRTEKMEASAIRFTKLVGGGKKGTRM